MNRILDTIVGPQSPLLGATQAHITTQITASNWHCKALSIFDDATHCYIFVTQQVCQRSRKVFFTIGLQHQDNLCTLVTFFELPSALSWLEHQLPTMIEDSTPAFLDRVATNWQ